MGMSESELANLGIPPMPAIGAVSARQPLGPGQGFYQDFANDPALAEKAKNFIPFVTDDEWVPATFAPEDRDRLKAKMNAAGLYGESGYASGTWNPDDARAYKYVLESANGMMERDADVVINQMASDSARSPRARGARAPLVNRISNPDDIRSVIRKASFDLTGSRLSDEEEQRLISMYQGSETAMNTAVHAGQGAASGTSSTITDAANPQTFAEAQIEALRPKEVASHRHLDAFERILQSMGTLAPDTPTFEGGGLPKVTGQEVL